jgi:transcriptional regulator with XRE-family HTH domain
VAKKLQVPKNAIYAWENDRRRPSARNLESLAKFFRVSRNTLKDSKRRELEVSKKG